MPYLGSEPAVGFASTTKQAFSGDASAVAFTLSRAASVATDLEVFVDNVQQEPTTAFGVSGTTLTFTAAPATGTNNIYVVHRQGGASATSIENIATDLSFKTDGAVLKFGANSEITLTHDHDVGLKLKHTATADDKPIVLTLQTGETDMAANDVMGKIQFQAPDEGTGTDAILVAAAIQAVSEGNFSSSANATALQFMTGASEAAATKMTLSSGGNLTVTGVGTFASLDISGAIDVDGTTNLDVVDIDGAVNIATTALVTGVLTTTAATVFNGGFASNAASTITTADNLSGLILESTDADAQVGPTLQLKRNSGSPADSDNLGNIIFVGENDADEAVVYGNIGFTAPDVSNGTEDGLFFLNVINAGTERSRMFMNATETVFNEESLNLDFRIESDGVQHMFHLDGQHSSVCIGNNTTTHRFIVHSEVSGDHVAAIRNDGNNVNKLGLVILAGTDDNSGTNTMIQFRDGDNTDVGSITASGGTVTYSAFTAVHPAILPGADNANGYAYGTLVETTSIAYEKNSSGNDFERGIIYNVTKSASANSRSVLGAYSGKLNAWISSSNKHNINILGDGHILCNNSGGNIAVGDGICTSATAGIGQKATVSPSMIIGIAQEAVTFSNGTETKLVPVQYGLQQFTPW